MTGFLGEYEATIDSKGRFLLPGGIKKQLPDTTTSVVINRGFEKCLNLYAIDAWNVIVEKIKKLNRFEPKVREFTRFFFGGATEVTIDTAGRLLIPPTLKEYAELDKDILLSSDIDKVEIWDSKRYKKLFEDISAHDFSKLAAEVMGGLNL